MPSYNFPTTKLNISREKLEEIKKGVGGGSPVNVTNKRNFKNVCMFPSPRGRSVRGKLGHGHN